MKWQRVKTIVLQSWYHLNYSVETWMDLFYGQAIQIIVFGFIAVYFSQRGSTDAQIIILGLLLWAIVSIAQYSLSLGMLWEVWSKSFSSLFITPLSMNEFLVGHMLGSLYKSLMVFVMMSGFGWWFYHFDILRLGWLLPVYYVEMLFFGWAVGMFTNGLILRFGTVIQSLAWGFLVLFQPLGAAFFPVKVLPPFFQTIASFVPLTYFFEVARSQLWGDFNGRGLWIGTGLNLIYFCLGFWFIHRMYRWARETGEFVRIEQ